MSKAEDFLQRWKGLRSARSEFDQHWQELAERLLPKRADITSETQPGAKRTEEIMDSTPMQARRELATTMHGMLLPTQHPWFNMQPVDDDLDEDEGVKGWLDHVERRMWQAIYDPKAKFIEACSEVFDDLVTFGTAVLFVTTNSLRNRLLFQCFHLRDCWIAEDHEGAVDTLYRRRVLTARQAAQLGYSSEKIDQALRDNKPETKCEYLHVVAPRNDRNPRLVDIRNMPFGYWIIDPKEEKQVDESGFEEFPFAVPRWETATEEVYGRSPGMLALPDVKTLNKMRRTSLLAGELAVDPPIAMPDETVIGENSLVPGGNVYYDATKINGSRNAIYPIVTNPDVRLGLEMENQTREMIWGCFLRNVLKIPVDSPQRTATEVLQLREEIMRVVGPTFGRQERDMNGAIVNRVFPIMQRAEAFDPPPEALAGRRVDFEFKSATQQVQKRIEVAASIATAEQVIQVAPLKPEVMDVLNWDEIVRDLAEGNGMPHSHIVGKREVEALRQARAQAQQAEQMAEMVERAAGAAGAAAPMVKAMEGEAA